MELAPEEMIDIDGGSLRLPLVLATPLPPLAGVALAAGGACLLRTALT